jgi:hypothetical protein
VFDVLDSMRGYKGLVDVIWDRRFADRRAGVSRIRKGLDRRRADRRGPPPGSWDARGYVLVPIRERPALPREARA